MMRVVGCFVYVALETWKFSPCLPTSWRRCGCCSATRGFVPSYGRAGAVLRSTPPPMTPMTVRTPGTEGVAQGGGVFANPMLASLASPRATGGATGDGSSGGGWRPTSAALTFSPMRPGSGARDAGVAPSEPAAGPAAVVSSAGSLATSTAWPGGQLAPGDATDTAPDAEATSVTEGDERTVLPAASNAATASAGPSPSPTLPTGC